VDLFFHADFVRGSLGNREYLFDQVPAFLAVVQDAHSVDDLARIMPSLSLATQGLLDGPTPPMLVLGGVKDTQVPISDFDLLMHSGVVVKDAWLNPVGGHLGRDASGWNDAAILRQVIMPWELKILQAP
jgi:hypothetical protein